MRGQAPGPRLASASRSRLERPQHLPAGFSPADAVEAERHLQEDLARSLDRLYPKCQCDKTIPVGT
jgi:hypothetical protein